MAKVWVLDTETKGTGANMVPLEDIERRPQAPDEMSLVRFGAPPTQKPPSERPLPRPFKVVDVMSRQTLAEGASARDVIEVLRRVRRIVDVNLYVWQHEPGRWRMLNLEERRAFWQLRAGLGRSG